MARILLIDDNDCLRTVMRIALADNGHTIFEADNGKDGLDLLVEANADLVITDMVMPEKGGLEVLQELRSKRPPVKTIAISGGSRHGAGDALEAAALLGASKVLAKPFSINALIAAVKELLPVDHATSQTNASNSFCVDKTASQKE